MYIWWCIVTTPAYSILHKASHALFGICLSLWSKSHKICCCACDYFEFLLSLDGKVRLMPRTTQFSYTPT